MARSERVRSSSLKERTVVKGVLACGSASLIADDYAMVREGFAAMLGAEPGIKVAGQAIDGTDAIRQTRSWRGLSRTDRGAL